MDELVVVLPTALYLVTAYYFAKGNLPILFEF